jgi:hypothetical protein
LVPPPWTGGQELWHSESDVQEPQVPPLLLPVELPLPLPLLLLPLPLLLPVELPVLLLPPESNSPPDDELEPLDEVEEFEPLPDDDEEVDELLESLPPSFVNSNPPFEESPPPQAEV